MCPREGAQETSQVASLCSAADCGPLLQTGVQLPHQHVMASLEGRPQLLGTWPGGMVAESVASNHSSPLGRPQTGRQCVE